MAAVAGPQEAEAAGSASSLPAGYVMLTSGLHRFGFYATAVAIVLAGAVVIALI